MLGVHMAPAHSPTEVEEDIELKWNVEHMEAQALVVARRVLHQKASSAVVARPVQWGQTEGVD